MSSPPLTPTPTPAPVPAPPSADKDVRMSRDEIILDDKYDFTRRSEKKIKNLPDMTYTPTLEDIKKENVRMTDENDKYQVYSYDKCGNYSTRRRKRMRGIIFNKEGKLVSMGAPYTTEILSSEVGRVWEPDFTSVMGFRIAVEGAMIRVWYDDGEWYMSTNRRLNADISKWSSRVSFGKDFKSQLSKIYEMPEDEALDYFYSLLDKENQYTFILANNRENRIVCDTLQSRIYLVSVYSSTTFKPIHFTQKIKGILSPKFAEGISDNKSLTFYAKNLDPYLSPGLIAENADGTVVSILNNEYFRLFKLRGNVPSIRFRYLQVRCFPELINDFTNLYSDFRGDFEDYERVITLLVNYIYDAYVRRFIKREYVSVPPDCYLILKKCHENYKQDRIRNKISLHKVMDIIDILPPSKLNRMIRNWKHAEDKIFKS